jgi:hypothetical protein
MLAKRQGRATQTSRKRVSSPGSRHVAQETQPIQPSPGPSAVARAQGTFSDATHPVVDPFADPVATTNRETGAREYDVTRLANGPRKTLSGVAATAALDESGKICMFKCRDRRSGTGVPEKVACGCDTSRMFLKHRLRQWSLRLKSGKQVWETRTRYLREEGEGGWGLHLWDGQWKGM